MSLRCRIAWARERVHVTPLPPANLRNDVGRGTEAIEADAAPLAGFLQRPPADEASTHQRRCSNRIGIAGKSKGVVGISHSVGSEAAVACIAGENRAVAEVLLARRAIATIAARTAEPRDADAPARRQRGHTIAYRLDDAHDLVPRDQRQTGLGQVTINDMQIGSANRAGLDADPNLSRPRKLLGPRFGYERPANGSQHHCSHSDAFDSRFRQMGILPPIRN
jgi:hypothetical protein